MIKRRFQVTSDILRDIQESFYYQQESGTLRWKKTDCTNISEGSIAGRKHNNGHIEVKFKHVSYMAHHIVWFLYYGKWPTESVIHINRNKADNRISNLRE